MAAPVYSTQFIAAGGFGAETVTYTVPAGYVAVLRNIVGRISSGNTAELTVSVVFENVLYLVDAVGSGSDTLINWQGNTVLEAGQVIQVIMGAGAYWGCVCSGFLLTAP